MIKIKEKKERALGTKLFIKAERCNSGKCAAVRRPYRPGAHGQSRRRALSEFGQQMNEKQKIRFSYGLTETQMRNVMARAAKSKGITGEMLVSYLERRLDNTVFRLGLAPSRFSARQLVSHGHFMVNSRRVTIPSYELKVGDIISIRPQSVNHPAFKDLAATLKKFDAPIWLDLNREKFEGKVISNPKEFEIPFNINVVIDYYSK